MNISDYARTTSISCCLLDEFSAGFDLFLMLSIHTVPTASIGAIIDFVVSYVRVNLILRLIDRISKAVSTAYRRSNTHEFNIVTFR